MAPVPSRQFSAIRLDLCAGSCRSGGNYMAMAGTAHVGESAGLYT